MNFGCFERKICFLPKFWTDDQNKVGHAESLVHVDMQDGEAFFQLPDRYAHHAVEYSS